MDENNSYILINKDQISPQALDQILENYILREGTDYGERDLTLETKKENLSAMLLNKKIVIVYDKETESVTLLPQEALNKIK